VGEKEAEEEAPKKDFVQWQQIAEKSFVPVGEIKTTFVVPPGIYDILFHRTYGLYLSGKELSLDELFILPSPEHDKILLDIQTFWARKEMFTKYKFTYKRGILLYGVAGGGKSSIINLLAAELVRKHKGIVLYLSQPDDLKNFVSIMPMLKQIEPDKQILCVLEDLEGFTAYREIETQLLNVLDGMNQMDNIVYLATSNYPEQLKERILNRPSRFDRRYEIGFPNNNVRREYFKHKLTQDDLKDINLEEWVSKTNGLTLAHLGEIVKSVCALGNTFDDTLNLLDEMKKKLNSYDFNKDSSEGIGFSKKK
jgi:hypothetical protein